MRVVPATRLAVAYVGSNINGNFLPVGTTFAVGIKYSDTNFFFFVTADHVVDLVQGGDIFIRMNLRSGTSGPPIRIAKSSKIPGIDRTLDLAIFPVPPLYETYDADYIFLDRARFESITREIWKPELGDEVAIVSLYTSHHGYTKNIPVVRVGHITMLPDEPVMSTRGYVEAYLVEVRSIVGLSGSPVYITLPSIRADRGQIEVLRSGGGAICIGMMLGYHLVASAEDQIVVPSHQTPALTQSNEQETDNLSLDERNTGFGVVLPVERLFDVMESDGMKRAMDEAIERPPSGTRVRPAGSPFVNHNAPSDDANPNHLEDFRRLVDVAARKRPQGDQT